jgi:hypothetical protein
MVGFPARLGRPGNVGRDCPAMRFAMATFAPATMTTRDRGRAVTFGIAENQDASRREAAAAQFLHLEMEAPWHKTIPGSRAATNAAATTFRIVRRWRRCVRSAPTGSTGIRHAPMSSSTAGVRSVVGTGRCLPTSVRVGRGPRIRPKAEPGVGMKAPVPEKTPRGEGWPGYCPATSTVRW